MSQLVVNLPTKKVWVRKEYLRDLQDGHGEFLEGVWVAAKSIPGRAFYFETYLPEYGALYDKLPITAFVNKPVTPDPDLDLPNLQFWNCMDYSVVCIRKQFISPMDFEVFSRNHGILKGQYLFTLDNYHQDPNIVDTNVSELTDEHKSHNCILLENGQFALYPTNRMKMYDLSLTPQVPKIPDFKVSTTVYQVENGVRWGRLGDTDEYFWQTPDERDSNPVKSSDFNESGAQNGPKTA